MVAVAQAVRQIWLEKRDRTLSRPVRGSLVTGFFGENQELFIISRITARRARAYTLIKFTGTLLILSPPRAPRTSARRTRSTF